MLDTMNRPVPSPREVAYTILQRAAGDPAFFPAFSQRPDDTIRSFGLMDPQGIAEVKMLVTLIGRGLQANSDFALVARKQLESTAATADAFKTALRKTMDQIDEGFQSTMTMSKVAFYLGILLIVASGFFAAFTGKTLISLIFAGLGAADVIGFFVVNPPRDIQRSRANLAQLQAAMYNWFADITNWNTYLGGLMNQPSDPFPRMQEVSKTLLDNTDRMMALIDKYCEVDGKK